MAATTKSGDLPSPAAGRLTGVRSRGVAAAGALVLGAAATVRLGRWLVPPSPLPAPTGPHPVATTVVQVEGARTLPVQVWYPSRTSEGPAARLFPAPEAPAVIARRYRLPPRLLAPLGRVTGHALAGAPAAVEAMRGVVVLVHGWLGYRTIHADLAEQWASEGWVVLAADHVGGAIVTQHLDGSVEGVDPTLMPPDGDPDYWPRATALVRRFAEDLGAVLEATADLPGVGMPVPDPDRVLLVGQSTGGGAAVAVAAADPRVTGILGLDPWVRPVPESDRRRLSCPMVAIRSGQWVGNDNDAVLQAMPSVQLRTLAQAGHTDLTGLGYLSPLLRLTGLSHCDPSLPHDAALAAFAELVELVS